MESHLEGYWATFVDAFVAEEHRAEVTRQDGDLGAKFDPSLIVVVDEPFDTACEAVLEQLVGLGAGDEGFVLASATAHVGIEPLAWFVRDVVGFQPLNLISCISGQLAFFEDFDDRHVVLSRPRRGPERKRPRLRERPYAGA